MEYRPLLPSVIGDENGGIVAVYDSKHSRQHVMLVQQQLEARGKGLLAWAESAPDRLDAFYEKIFTKTIVKELEVSVVRSIDDVINELDGSPTDPQTHPEIPIDADFDEHYE